MFSGTGQVVGLIELDRPASLDEQRVSLPLCGRARHAALGVAHIVAASGDDETITADLYQLKRELRAELAFVLKRLGRLRR